MPTNILMPALSPTMEEGTLAKWHVKEGDVVKAGDVIAEIETDKATMEVEAVDEGRVGRILVAEGTEGVKVNAPIATLLEDGEEADAAGAKSPAPQTAAKAPSPQPSPPREEGVKTATVSKSSASSKVEAEQAAGRAPILSPRLEGQGERVKQSNGGHIADKAPLTERIFASPLARRVATERGLDLTNLQGSGPHGRIILRDVEGGETKAPSTRPSPQREDPTAPAKPPAAPLAMPDPRGFFEKGEYEEIPHDAMRKAIARRLSLSMQTIPHYYLTVDCDIDALLKMRKELNAKSPEGEGAYKLSVNDFVVRAVALSLIKYPACNVTWTDNAMLRHHRADIGIAVALEGGLITPILRHTELKGLKEISREVADLAERARARKLKPQEYEGGSFAISNLGMYGIKDFTAIINPPHAAILAVGRGEERAVVKDGALAKASVMSLTMSCDHRAIDGATGAQFLQILKGFLEDPATMLL